MVAYIKYLKQGGETTVTNLWDGKIVNNGVVVSPFGKHEMKSFTCKHCCHVTFVPAGVDPMDHLGGRCTCCNALICKKCASVPICTPLEYQLELSERGLLSEISRNTPAELARKR